MQTVFVTDELKAQFREVAGHPVDPVVSDTLLHDASAAVERLVQQTRVGSYLDPEVAERLVGAA